MTISLARQNCKTFESDSINELKPRKGFYVYGSKNQICLDDPKDDSIFLMP